MMERKPILVILTLLIFHVAVTTFMHFIASSSILSTLHNGHGVWNFAKDSFIYHDIAINLAGELSQGHWSGWWYGDATHSHVKWIALIYWMVNDDPLSFELVNAPVWVLSITSIWAAGRLLFQDAPRLAYIPAVLFGFLPSYFLCTTQLLKDPFYIIGLCFIMLGWILLYQGRMKWIGSALLVAGFTFAVSVRPYLMPIFLSVLVFGLFFLLVTRAAVRYQSMAALLLILFCTYLELQPLPDYAGYPSVYAPLTNVKPPSPYVGYDVGDVFSRMSDSREKFLLFYSGSGSNIDVDRHFYRLADIVEYIPRALQIGLFSPFPNQWIEPGRDTGRIGRMISGAEMLLWYILFVGSILCFWKGRRLWSSLALITALALVTITLLGLAVPNVGAIYRMRTGYLIPFFILGPYGLYALLKQCGRSAS